MDTKNNSLIHLIVEPRTTTLAKGEPKATGPFGEKGWAPLPIPPAVSFLSQRPDAAPQLAAAEPEGPMGTLAVEPVTLREGRPCLLLVSSATARLRVNGNPAPRVALLRERDQFQFDDSSVFHVAIYHRPQTGPPPPDKIGKPCPVCLTSFSASPDSICYQCQCGTVLHLQHPAGLECARAVSACPHCQQVISLKEGYTWLPNFER